MQHTPDYFNILLSLTSREKEIIGHIAGGYNSSEIADKINLSFETINTHRRNILNKTRCRNMTEVAVKCVMAGIVSV